MVAGSITQEIAMAVPTEPVWKAAFTGDGPSMTKALAGLVDAVDVDGDGGPGSLITMKFNNPVEPAGVGGCVVKLSVDYEHLDGTPLPAEDQAKLITGYVGLVKKVEENIVAPVPVLTF
ncbi:hypothetical protein HU200_042352 [Digitaria exilis]|uniref:Bet v I/Major latex protein domain-containing protein n=1 Tax=Digitaria exilis TaxID=1010633 RepID=A0A835B574_9POAL|nr:hypothetical protein HU200_042352 [Digitaria exilis]